MYIHHMASLSHNELILLKKSFYQNSYPLQIGWRNYQSRLGPILQKAYDRIIHFNNNKKK